MKTDTKVVYLKALGVWLAYTVGGKLIFLGQMVNRSWLEAYGVVGSAAAIFGAVFLYLFSHEAFFKFARVIEKKEQKQEKRWLGRFSHTGRIVATLIIGILAGPLFSALTARMLLPRHRLKYQVVVGASLVGGWAWLFIFRAGWLTIS